MLYFTKLHNFKILFWTNNKQLVNSRVDVLI